MTWLMVSLMAAAAAATGILLSRIERVRIQPPTPSDPTHNRRRSDRAPA